MSSNELPLDQAISAFLSEHSMSPVTFGRGALNDPHFVAQFRAGRRVWPETEEKVRRFMASYRPGHQAAA